MTPSPIHHAVGEADMQKLRSARDAEESVTVELRRYRPDLEIVLNQVDHPRVELVLRGGFTERCERMDREGLPGLADAQITLELVRLHAMLNDGHSEPL